MATHTAIIVLFFFVVAIVLSEFTHWLGVMRLREIEEEQRD